MTAAIISSLAPAKLNSTVLAIRNLRIQAAIDAQPFRHSGNLYPSVMYVPGATPAVTFQTPFLAAYTLIGLGNGALKLTTFEVYLASFADSVRLGALSHTKYGLNTSCVGFAYITGFSVDTNGILMADVSVALISNDGMTHPLKKTGSVSLPVLASEPALHSLGPVDINGVVIGGLNQMAVDTGYQTQLLKTDGDLYARNFACMGADRVLNLTFKDALTVWNDLTLLGADISANVVQYLRAYDPTTQVKLGTGLSITMASGRAVQDALTSENLALNETPVKVIPLSATATDPMIIATGVAIPTP